MSGGVGMDAETRKNIGCLMQLVESALMEREVLSRN